MNSKGDTEVSLDQRGNAAEGALEVADPGRVRSRMLEVAVRVAESICNGAPVAVGAAFNAVRAADPVIEDKMYERCLKLGATDRAEGLNAFKEKRAPHYRGAPGSGGETGDENSKSPENEEEV